ncbi:hypothetical protein [Streptomyces griseus]|uniref:hypothetical protein n=1 Tax=Streptomyces griseus TaxID=1911 RepID=UPI0008961584|nr:hypothetical protein [Streptomyces griseus]SEE24514.1 hypothetical protein SAMN04490359_2359 [Streptomyces griseus]SQA21883.1 Uncharacterised protein [Streptomyces griseus]
MPETDATGQTETKGEDDAPEPGPPTPRLYSVTTHYTDQFLGGQQGPDLLCDDAVTALHFALTTSSSRPLAVTCSTTADGRTWTPLPLHLLHADARSTLQQNATPAMYPGPASNSRPHHGRPRNTGPRYGQKHATDHDLAVAEKQLRDVHRRYADTQTEFALSVTLGRIFDQIRTPHPPTHTTTAPRPSRRTGPAVPTGHDQATAAALLPGPTAHGPTTA